MCIPVIWSVSFRWIKIKWTAFHVHAHQAVVHIQLLMGCENSIRNLLEFGAGVKCVDGDGKTPVEHIPVVSELPVYLMRMLLNTQCK